MEIKWEPLKARRILALDPGQRGVGFAVVQIDPFRLLAFGTKSCRSSARALRVEKAVRLVQLYEPEVVVLEDWRMAARMRRDALRPFALAFCAEMHERDIYVWEYPPDRIRRFHQRLGVRTKTEMARALAARFPELIWRVPPVRMAWMTEDDQMGVFDALTLALLHLDEEGQRVTARGP